MTAGNVKSVVPPVVEPVLLAEALNQCHANAGYEDEWFSDAIRQARYLCEEYQWRAYITQTFDLWFDGTPKLPIEIPRAPLQSVTSIEIYDVDNVAHAVDMQNVYVDTVAEPGRVFFNEGIDWPDGFTARPFNTACVRFVAGYGDSPANVPDHFKRAILLHVGWAYNHRAGEVADLPDAFYSHLSADRLYR